MDNVTHSLAGLLLAEAAIRLRTRHAGTGSNGTPAADRPPRIRTVATIAAMIAANLPDADLFYTGVGGDRLGYMLHHRGHTHTVVVAIVGAVLLWGIVALAWRWRAGTALARDDARWLLGLLLAGTLSHVALDWTNSYGVHPLWPADDRWYYGDAVFIIEPWLWVVSVPALVAASTSRLARALLAAVLLAGLGLAWRVDLVSAGAATALTVGAILVVALTRWVRPGARIPAAIAGWLAVTLVMAAASAQARATALRAAREWDPAADVLDVIVSPLPASAVCMAAITVERSGATYRVATARVSTAPWMTSPSRCGVRDAAGSRLGPSPRRSTSAMQWDAEWSAPSAELATLARESCPALAALRFLRAPIWHAAADGTVLLGDVRYGGGSGNSFTDVRVPRRSSTCPRRVPPWTPPRSDLLELRQ